MKAGVRIIGLINIVVRFKLFYFIFLQSQATADSLNLNAVSSASVSLNDQIQIPTDYGTKTSEWTIIVLKVHSHLQYLFFHLEV